MAILHIEEYSSLAKSVSGSPIQAPGPVIAAQQVTITGTSAQSAALNASTEYVVLTATADAYFKEAVDPTAAVTDRFLPANTPRAFLVKGGNKIAGITA